MENEKFYFVKYGHKHVEPSEWSFGCPKDCDETDYISTVDHTGITCDLTKTLKKLSHRRGDRPGFDKIPDTVLGILEVDPMDQKFFFYDRAFCVALVEAENAKAQARLIRRARKL